MLLSEEELFMCHIRTISALLLAAFVWTAPVSFAADDDSKSRAEQRKALREAEKKAKKKAKKEETFTND